MPLAQYKKQKFLTKHLETFFFVPKPPKCWCRSAVLGAVPWLRAYGGTYWTGAAGPERTVRWGAHSISPLCCSRLYSWDNLIVNHEYFHSGGVWFLKADPFHVKVRIKKLVFLGKKLFWELFLPPGSKDPWNACCALTSVPACCCSQKCVEAALGLPCMAGKQFAQ